MDRSLELTVALPSGARMAVPVTRKRVKNLNLRIRPDGTLSMSIPEGLSTARAQDFLDRHAPWIERRLALVAAREDDARVPTEGEQKGTLPLWGRLVDARGISDVDALYRHEVERALPAVVEHLEARMGVQAASWHVRQMTSRWGSCTPARRTIRINAALAAYPPACLEAVVAHELTHLLEPTHNARFHALLDEFCPKNRQMRALLRKPAREVAAG